MASFQWPSIFSDALITYPLLAPDGTAAAPSFAFTNAAGTGLYLFGANSLGFASNGLTAGNIDSSQNWTMVGTITSNSVVIGSAANRISGLSTIINTGTLTLPTATDTLVGRATTDTLTNKTLTGNTAVNLISGSGTLTLNTSGTVTLPNATDTLTGKATTDTLTNKTISGSSNTLSNIADGSLSTSYVKADGSRALSAGWDTTQIVQFKGVTSGSAASAGYVSETLTAFSGGGGSPAFVNSGTTGQFFDIASQSITAGRWLLIGTAEAKTNGATLTELSIGIGTATGNSSTGLTNGYTFYDIPLPISTDLSGTSITIPINISGTATYYLKGFASFTVATPQVRGTLIAIRLP